MKIIFQNSDFIAIDKQSGYLSVPSRKGLQETRKIAGLELEKQLEHQIFPVHRLDVDVSGILLFANNAAAHREASRAFEEHFIQKEYQAFSSGPLPSGVAISKEEIWTCRLAKGKKRAFEAPHGKEAITLAICKSELFHDGVSYLDWRLFPKTGRSHQLRYEMFRHERSILGDELYGSNQKLINTGIALRAIALDFSKAQQQGLLKSLPSNFSIEPYPLNHWVE
jgi:tRNA pseudouridine32 synthase/23S rRNA pseudouridine746 synthase